jgi:hypothetical protein
MTGTEFDQRFLVAARDPELMARLQKIDVRRPGFTLIEAARLYCDLWDCGYVPELPIIGDLDEFTKNLKPTTVIFREDHRFWMRDTTDLERIGEKELSPVVFQAAQVRGLLVSKVDPEDESRIIWFHPTPST